MIRLQKQPLYDSPRCCVSVCDITKDPLPEEAFIDGGVDFALFMFCLSALHPDKMRGAVRKIAGALKPGGKVSERKNNNNFVEHTSCLVLKIFFRDYGRYDQAQLRFKAGHKLQENFYVRQDNTRVYYFTTGINTKGYEKRSSSHLH